MGYYTHYTEEITITPPIPYSKVKGTPFLADEEDFWGWNGKDVKFEITEDSEGKRYASAIGPAQEDEYKGYHIVEHVQEIVDMFGDNHEFSGYINAEGEETGDLWRLYVLNGTATAIKPEIIWPEV
jgi:hypothetical protein